MNVSLIRHGTGFVQGVAVAGWLVWAGIHGRENSVGFLLLALMAFFLVSTMFTNARLTARPGGSEYQGSPALFAGLVVGLAAVIPLLGL